MGSGFRVSGFRVQGSGFRVQGPSFRVQGSGFRVQGSGFRVQGSGFGVYREVTASITFKFRVQGLVPSKQSQKPPWRQPRGKS